MLFIISPEIVALIAKNDLASNLIKVTKNLFVFMYIMTVNVFQKKNSINFGSSFIKLIKHERENTEETESVYLS